MGLRRLSWADAFSINPLSHGKVLELSEFQAIADNKFYVARMIGCSFERKGVKMVIAIIFCFSHNVLLILHHIIPALNTSGKESF